MRKRDYALLNKKVWDNTLVNLLSQIHELHKKLEFFLS